jgi:hypothetical protein
MKKFIFLILLLILLAAIAAAGPKDIQGSNRSGNLTALQVIQ